MNSVDKFLAAVSSQEGAPYVWAGKGETVLGMLHPFVSPKGHPIRVFDCSGLITWALRKCGWKVRGEYWADRMWKEWPHTDSPQPGDFILYGEGIKATHVEILMPDGRFFGAIGGNSKTTKPAPGAAVGYRETSRKDILGYVSNPLRAQTTATSGPGSTP